MKDDRSTQVCDSTAPAAVLERVFLIVGASLLLVAAVVEQSTELTLFDHRIRTAGVFLAVVFIWLNLRIWRVIYFALVGIITDVGATPPKIKIALAITCKLILILGWVVLFLAGDRNFRLSFLIGFISCLFLSCGGLILVGISRQGKPPGGDLPSND